MVAAPLLDGEFVRLPQAKEHGRQPQPRHGDWLV